MGQSRKRRAIGGALEGAGGLLQQLIYGRFLSDLQQERQLEATELRETGATARNEADIAARTAAAQRQAVLTAGNLPDLEGRLRGRASVQQAFPDAKIPDLSVPPGASVTDLGQQLARMTNLNQVPGEAAALRGVLRNDPNIPAGGLEMDLVSQDVNRAVGERRTSLQAAEPPRLRDVVREDVPGQELQNVFTGAGVDDSFEQTGRTAAGQGAFEKTVFDALSPGRVDEAVELERLLATIRSETPRQASGGEIVAITDIDASLTDLQTLREVVTQSGATGIGPLLGAALPNFVTEATGIGLEAKQRQAVIDRVKQVIGKALEGGVLRKEDEEKYKLILPTIGDPPAVVITKLDGLEAAMGARRTTLLENLQRGRVDISQFPPSPSGAPIVSGDPNYGTPLPR